MASHSFRTTVTWTGNLGRGTADYRAYDRSHRIEAEGKPPVAGSSDPAFRGDGACWNPEDMLVGSLSACHMLWFLHLASEAGWVVESYQDRASGTMAMNPDGSGEFTGAMLAPQVVISAGDPALSDELHRHAHEKCFVARSVNFPVRCEGDVSVTAGAR